MSTWDPTHYGPAIAKLLEPTRVPPLAFGPPHLPAQAALQALDADGAFSPFTVRDQDMAGACRAGLWLLHDFFEQAHEISQELETPEGSYWHALVHRREPDHGNPG